MENEFLNRAIDEKKLSHAYLFHGETSFSKLKMAKEFYKKIIEKDLDNKEKVFHQIDNNEFEELLIIDVDTKEIKKEEIIKIKSIFNKKPLLASKKCYIINNADRLNKFSANSILKFLEEPEKDIIAILIISNLNILLPTIISRCQLISLGQKVAFDKKWSLILHDESKEEREVKVDLAKNLFNDILFDSKKVIKIEEELVKEYFFDRNEYIKYLNLFLVFISDYINSFIEKKDNKFNLEKLLLAADIIGEEMDKQKNNVNTNLSFCNLVIGIGGLE